MGNLDRTFFVLAGLSVLALAMGAGAYFLGRRPRPTDYNKIAKAVEFFGGRLVIDWQDE